MPLKQIDENWVWRPDTQSYRDIVTGRILGPEQCASLTEALRAIIKKETARIANDLAGGTITLNEWENSMRTMLRDAYITQYALGVGGIDRLTAAERYNVHLMLRKQYAYLRNFREAIARGELSAAQISNRAGMYVSSSNQAWGRSTARAAGLPELPAYPGDGSTQCLTNCQCRWEIVDRGDHWDCYWRLGIAEHCPDCVERARNWNPLTIPKEEFVETAYGEVEVGEIEEASFEL